MKAGSWAFDTFWGFPVGTLGVYEWADHGSDNAWDEAVYLTLHTLHLPLDRLEPFLDAHLLPHEREALLDIYRRRCEERLPAAYLTNEAWLGEHRFYVDDRVIVPRSFIAELLDEQLTPWIEDPWGIASALDLCTRYMAGSKS